MIPSDSSPRHSYGRRKFLQRSGLAASGAIFAPNLLTAQKSGSGAVVIGEGEHRYEVVHNWPKLPDRYTWQTTHNVAVDRDANLYVIHEGVRGEDHPSIFVFDAQGNFVRAFGSQFQGGGHGLEVRSEGGEQFLYVTGYQHLKNFAKLTLEGEQVWEQHAPMESGRYKEGEDTHPEKVWGRDRFMPTNFAFHPSDGGYYLADGYGAHCIHRYDKDNRWLASFGGHGKEDGKFNLPHGLWIDARGGAASLVVADRANARLQWFDLEGEHLRTLGGFILPANVDVLGDLMLVPDLSARISLLDSENKVIAQLGEDEGWRKEVLKGNKKMRTQPVRWEAGKFVHPHDACFDAGGNIFVAEWVATGRVTKLKKLA
ncbi:MAG: twin-arginine translocation signal domain-containing protein [Verrucomicrobiales bacterium]